MRNWKGYLAAGIPVALVAAFPLVVESSYYINTITVMILFAISAVGLNLLLGVAGQISMGQAGFMMIGAYTSALLTAKLGVPMWLGIVAAAVVSAIVGFLLGLPALRLQGNFLALATLGFAGAIRPLILKFRTFTGGDMGFTVVSFGSARTALWVGLAVLVALSWLTANIVKTRPGRALLALRDDEVAAQSMGVNLATAKTAIFALTSAYAGIAGALIAHFGGYITPRDFTLLTTFNLMAGVVVGGLGSIPGAIIGSALITLLPIATSRTQGLSTVLEGLAILVMVLFVPRGLVSLLNRSERGRRRVAA